MSITRYNFVIDNDYDYCGCSEVEADDGEYVRYEEYQKLRAVIDRVRALHQPTFDGAHCVVCHSSDSSDWDFYPCPTIRALDGDA